MRIRLLLSLAALAPITVLAETLSPEAALRRALGDTRVQKVMSPTARPELLYTEISETTSTPAAYIYSRGDQGFMVVSADDVAAPVLGYSDSNEFDADNIPANLRAWLGFYADEIDWARRNGVALYAPQKSSRADRAAIAPLVKTFWDQGAPYNEMCPKISNRNAVTGCVATAMAQIMNYHQWPVSAGAGKATVSVSGSSYTMDFSKTVFDWNNMLDSYTSTASQTQKDAVALLMKACGFSVDMNYSTSASGAVQARVSSALINNFGYDKGVSNAKRECYTTNDWNDLVYSQLAQKQPVQYGGQSSAGGHSFVCDGYSQNNYFHINWGWGGVSDGYFLLSALDPENQGTGGSGNGSGFDSDQDIVYNICKPKGTPAPIPALYAKSMNISAKSVGFNSQLSVSVTGLGNISPVSPIDATLGLAFVNKSTGRRIICPSSYSFTGLSSGSYFSSAISYSVTTRASSSMTAGEYDIVPVFCQGTGSSMTYEWIDIPVFVGTTRYVATASSSSIAISALTPSIATTDIVPETLYQGVPSKITVTVKNSGSATFLGTIKARLRKGTTTTTAYTGQNMTIEVEPNTSATFEYYITVPRSTAAGTYNLIFLEGSSNVITSPAKMNVTVATPPTLELSFGDLKVVGDEMNVDPRNVHFTMPLTCTSFKYDGTFPLYFFPYTSGTVSSIGSLASQPVSIAAGETKTIVFQGDVPALEYGKQYFCSVRYNDDWVGQQVVFRTKNEDSGIEDVTADKAVASETYFNLQGVAVSGTPSAGHYIKVTTFADGSRKAEHAVVK